MIGFGGQEQRRMTHLVQSMPEIVVPQELEPVDVAAARRACREPDESLDLGAIRVRECRRNASSCRIGPTALQGMTVSPAIASRSRTCESQYGNEFRMTRAET